MLEPEVISASPPARFDAKVSPMAQLPDLFEKLSSLSYP
jgi:hypothetical protein